MAAYNRISKGSKRQSQSKYPDCWVLALSKGNTRLFRFLGGRLTEVMDGQFPLRYIEQFQHEPRTGQIVQYFDDESKVNENRLHSYYRHVSHVLEPHLKSEDLPVVLMTANTNAGDFKRVTHLEDRIVRCVHGNYDRHRVSALQQLLREKLRMDKTPGQQG